MKILLSGMLAGVPGHGGATWAVLQYLLGLRRLGHEVCFVEPLARSAHIGNAMDLQRSESGRYFRGVVDAFDVADAAALVVEGTRESVGLPFDRVAAFASDADVLINLSGMLRDEELTAAIPVRAYLDLDPGFTQVWSAVDGIDMGFDRHTHLVTVGLALPRKLGPIPLCGRPWIPSLPPVVLHHWPVAGAVERPAFTSVANWRGYGTAEVDGVRLGQKVHSFRDFVALPSRAQRRIEVALSIHPLERGDRTMLETHGWCIVDPHDVASTPDRYRRFLQGSFGELCIAKEGYVVGRTGWFSDRSACYLASGRPVAAQDTGFASALPTDEGLLTFSDTESAADALERIDRDYERHRRAARRIAEEHLDSDRVLSHLLRRVAEPEPAVLTGAEP